MTQQPLISIVTPSFNQGQYLPETLQSLVDQQYPALEVIVQDGGSTDDSVEIAQEFARRHPGMFQVHCEKDRGQAHALNLGFGKARGEILGFLNSDDTLQPGCLRSVAREIDPARGRFVVFGRCLFTGEDSPYVGVEHPAEWVSQFEHLAIWKRGYNSLPQPSVFWHRQVWERCGGLNEQETHVLDYDLFCAFGERYAFHRVDELWSTYRMHAVSKSAQRTEAEVLAMSIAASRRHWGAWWRPRRWRLATSHWWHRRQVSERARHHARRAEQAFTERRLGTAVWEAIRTGALSPRLAWHRLVVPLMADSGLAVLQRAVWKPGTVGGEFAQRYSDGWIGPCYREEVAVPASAGRIVVQMQHHPQAGYHERIAAELWLDGRLLDRAECTRAGNFELSAAAGAYQGRRVQLELRLSPYFVPSLHGAAGDERKLCATLHGVHCTETAPA